MDVLYWSIFTACTVIVWLMLFPFLIYHAYKFWKHRDVNIISKREPILALTFAVIGTIIHLS